MGAKATAANDFIRESVLALGRTSSDVVGGVAETVGDSDFGIAVAQAQSSRFGVGGVAFRQAETVQERSVDTVAYGAYRRSTFEHVGLFDEELVRDQDDELNYRIRAHGGQIHLSPRIRYRYVSRSSASRLWTQYYLYGLYKVRVLQKHPRMMQPRHFVPPAAVAGGLVGIGAIFVGGRKALLADAALACLYATGVVSSAVAGARRVGWRRLPALLATFPILHASYGSGFLVGLVRFMTQWWRSEPPPPPLAPPLAAGPSVKAHPSPE
jgi:hypothetical protein